MSVVLYDFCRLLTCCRRLEAGGWVQYQQLWLCWRSSISSRPTVCVHYLLKIDSGLSGWSWGKVGWPPPGASSAKLKLTHNISISSASQSASDLCSLCVVCRCPPHCTVSDEGVIVDLSYTSIFSAFLAFLLLPCYHSHIAHIRLLYLVQFYPILKNQLEGVTNIYWQKYFSYDPMLSEGVVHCALHWRGICSDWKIFCGGWLRRRWRCGGAGRYLHFPNLITES